MSSSPLIAGLGHALLDITLETGDKELAEAGLTRGTMALADNGQLNRILDGRKAAKISSGGAVANSLAAAAMLGARTKLVGAVGDDEEAAQFIEDLAQLNVDFSGHRHKGGATGRCLVMVSENAERTMLTCLGASTGFAAAHKIAADFAAARFGYLELYLMDSDKGREAALAAAAAITAQKGVLLLNFSDPLCVERHRAELDSFLAAYRPLIIANEHEICAYFATRDFAAAAAAARNLAPRLALTRSEAGSLVIEAGEIHPVAAQSVARVMDSTGAGDAYAGGLLFALAEGASMRQAALLGSMAGAAAVQQFGARPALKAELAARWRQSL